jgi:hypothetical protein
MVTVFICKSPLTRVKYKTRLDKFFNFIGLEGNTVEERSYNFIEGIRKKETSGSSTLYLIYAVSFREGQPQRNNRIYLSKLSLKHKAIL